MQIKVTRLADLYSLAVCILYLVAPLGHKGKSPSLGAGRCGIHPHWQSTEEC